VPYGLRLYQHGLDDYVLSDGGLDEGSILDMLDKLYCDAKCRRYKLHMITDSCDSELC